LPLWKSPDHVDWINVDDPVMGGRSRSTTHVVYDSDTPVLLFEGNVSLANNGGFCSTRTEGTTWHFPNATAFVLDVRAAAESEPRRYAFTVRTSSDTSGSYRCWFEPVAHEWTSLHLPIEDFEFFRRGTHIASARPLDPTTLHAVGFLIGDKQEGPFALDFRRLEVAAKTNEANQTNETTEPE
jgi:hypothetical protein